MKDINKRRSKKLSSQYYRSLNEFFAVREIFFLLFLSKFSFLMLVIKKEDKKNGKYQNSNYDKTIDKNLF